MPKLIALDDGHGMETAGKRTPSIPELGGRVIHENEFNREVVKYLKAELERCGFRTILVAPTDEDTPLSTRVGIANSNNADAYISIHYNAYDGSFGGLDPHGNSVHIYPGSTSSRKLAESVGKYLRQGTTQNWRGVIENDFYVLRETKMVAILSENGFMDNKREAMLMINVEFQKEVAKEHAQGICEYFGVTYVPEPPPPPPSVKIATSSLYVHRVIINGVQVGAYRDDTTVLRIVAEHLEKGTDSILLEKV